MVSQPARWPSRMEMSLHWRTCENRRCHRPTRWQNGSVQTSERNFPRRIDLTSLQLFVAVCELGSIGKAAEREFIAASAVSKRLSDLEATLDTALLYRHTRGVDLTPAGESLLHHARSVLFSLEKMQGELSEYAEGVRGHVRVH